MHTLSVECFTTGGQGLSKFWPNHYWSGYLSPGIFIAALIQGRSIGIFIAATNALRQYMNSQLTTVEVYPESTHRYSVIWLHGLGADGHDFEGIVSELDLINGDGIHFIFPNAPVQPVTVNGGMKMRSWYDILELSLERRVDVDGIYQSSALIEQLIQQEMDKGIVAGNILLAGFSQGGVVALHTGLRYKYKLAGMIGLSTYLPTIEQLNSERSVANNVTSIMMAHGTLDPVVAIESGKAAYAALLERGYSIEWHEFVMEHAVCVEELNYISDFINVVF